MAKKTRSGPSKSQAIRDCSAANPTFGPKEVAEALNKEGFPVTPEYVSTIWSLDKAKARKGKKKAAAAARAASPAKSTDSLSLDALVSARKLAEQLGGIDQVQAAIDALKKLGL